MTEIANSPHAPETPEIRLKRLRMRSWRRGFREMDLLLGGWWDAHGAALDRGELAAYEALLEEPDWDIYYWITGAAPVPEGHAPLIGRIAAHHGTR
ncbi:succinate dehydrogenase assembly factor 2 [Paralimibaculum aggregatum]|uniref:FAD assembly factor SdhE n=1 Tax=Paralimibaculum aggregatum TaxID=3036245 RepID=A0ABQ6LIB6_9RHOB|nr:succinate dehydrogenase assembly factor 2 [Limibaculum sp. NKW23]GMG82722.1 succinate dehydrogenase assembly factor 2 [Limibaculum sp. NKW23]